MRVNFRPSVFAIDWPSEVLPTPGGPDEAEDRPREVALLELRDREVLDDPVLDLVQVVVVGIEHLAGLDEVEVVLRLLVPAG